MSKAFIASFIRFCRWPNLVMIVLLFLLFDHFIIHPLRDALGSESALDRWQFALLITDVLVVTIVGYWLNDFYDINVDSINRPNRFLVKYKISPGRFLSWVLALLSVGIAITVCLAFTENKLPWSVLFPFTVTAIWMYAKHGKKWGIYGNVLVSFCIACLPLLCMIAEMDLLVQLKETHPDLYQRFMFLMLCFTSLIFLLNLAREIVKDLEDMGGDLEVNAKSMPIRSGVKRSKTSVVLLLGLSAAVQWGLFFLFEHSSRIFFYSLVLSLLVVACGIMVLKSRSSSGYAKASLVLKLLMVFGLLELIFTPIL